METDEQLVRPYEVYRLTEPSGLVYIGCAWGKTAEQRWKCHQRGARNGTHCGSPLLAEKIRNGAAFTLEILECGRAERFDAYRREEHFLNVELNRSPDNVLNRNLQPSIPGSNPQHPETRAKIGAASKVRMNLPENVERTRQTAREVSSRPEHLARMRNDNPAKYITPEKRAEITKKITGRKRSDESRRRYSEASKKRWSDPEARRRLGNAIKKSWDGRRKIDRRDEDQET